MAHGLRRAVADLRPHRPALVARRTSGPLTAARRARIEALTRPACTRPSIDLDDNREPVRSDIIRRLRALNGIV